MLKSWLFGVKVLFAILMMFFVVMMPLTIIQIIAIIVLGEEGANESLPLFLLGLFLLLTWVPLATSWSLRNFTYSRLQSLMNTFETEEAD